MVEISARYALIGSGGGDIKKSFILLALVVGGSSLATHSMAVPLIITMSVPSVSGSLDGVDYTDLPIAFTIQVDVR